MEQDIARMQAAHFNMVRMGEFAWHLFEPEEGRFDFSWLDPHIEKLGKAGISTLMCTPTATPPRWLTEKYPEVLRIGQDGQPLRHGSRQHASHFNRVFRDLCNRINRALADHYADNPYVVGWQTDNEFHCHFCEDHQPDVQIGFREFLQKKYGTIGELNKAWGADFWAMAYQNFDQIETPIPGKPTHLNPAHVLDYQRCLSWGVTRFQKDQIDILRAANPEWWITHNGCFGSIDYQGAFTEDLDFLGFDSYPFFDYNVQARWKSHAFNLDYTRAYSGNFIIPEQQSGPGGQTNYFHDNPEPGEMRRMAYSSISRGADSLLFFRWRTCRFGAEEYWCGLLDHDNIAKRRLTEAGQLGAELKKIGPEILGSSVNVWVGVAGGDFDAQVAHQALHLGLKAPRQASENVHRCFTEQGYATGIVHPSDDLSGLSVYLIPHMPLFKNEWISNLQTWVEGGGTLVVGPRAGCKDIHNNVISDPLPGCLQALTGTMVNESGRQNNPEQRPLLLKIDDQSVQTDLWYEELYVEEGTDVIGTWESRFLRGQAAVSCRKLGKGRVIHLGTWFTDPVLDLLSDWLKNQKLLPLPHPVPANVEVVERLKPDGTLLRFVINHNDEAVEIDFRETATDLLTGETVSGTKVLEPNEVLVLKCLRSS